MARKVFVHEAELVLDDETDPARVGAVVTDELCGRWDHDGPCRWPNNNHIDAAAVPATFRTMFVAEQADEWPIRRRIDRALEAGDGWTVVSSGPRPVKRHERDLAERLARAPHLERGDA